ncbi:winged helix-turn-helix domain-containing protein [Paenibacillus sp. N1-5-1-14]|uniref:winged helix-turn-helix domain-containing protein n=1 Tax=Paenibacillus radicibacter TaxID=2972488 RepID=UPI002159B17A|nr:winged helix-turn-helix domain-containing protein [Paenibacillus radicibacter]MCR8643931.1 winged helix-turn-helix domain-containing protein [Paenibacillus radicibacter]
MNSNINLSDVEMIKVMLDPRRYLIMKHAEKEPVTVKQLAEKLDEKPSRLYYHVNKLEEIGVLQLVETKTQGNLIEKYYQTNQDATRAYNIDPAFAQKNSGIIMQELSRVFNQAMFAFENVMQKGKLEDEEDVTSAKIAYKSLTAKQVKQKIDAYDILISGTDGQKNLIEHLNTESSEPDDGEKDDYVFILMSYRMKDAEKS